MRRSPRSTRNARRPRFPESSRISRASRRFPRASKPISETTSACATRSCAGTRACTTACCRTSPIPHRVVVGRDGWLFLTGHGELEAYDGSSLFTRRELQGWARLMRTLPRLFCRAPHRFYSGRRSEQIHHLRGQSAVVGRPCPTEIPTRPARQASAAPEPSIPRSARGDPRGPQNGRGLPALRQSLERPPARMPAITRS